MMGVRAAPDLAAGGGGALPGCRRRRRARCHEQHAGRRPRLAAAAGSTLPRAPACGGAGVRAGAPDGRVVAVLRVLNPQTLGTDTLNPRHARPHACTHARAPPVFCFVVCTPGHARARNAARTVCWCVSFLIDLISAGACWGRGCIHCAAAAAGGRGGACTSHWVRAFAAAPRPQGRRCCDRAQLPGRPARRPLCLAAAAGASWLSGRSPLADGTPSGDAARVLFV